MSEAASPAFEGWAILELMGHRRLAGYVREVTMFGTALCRIDVPEVEGQARTTQFFTASAVYCVTPTTEEIARRVARGVRPAPVSLFELEAPKKLDRAVRYDDEPDPFDDRDDDRDEDDDDR